MAKRLYSNVTSIAGSSVRYCRKKHNSVWSLYGIFHKKIDKLAEIILIVTTDAKGTEQGAETFLKSN